jgi:hypothetical protein
LIGAALGLVVVSLIGFVVVARLKLHNRLETTDADIEVGSEEVLVEVHA